MNPIYLKSSRHKSLNQNSKVMCKRGCVVHTKAFKSHLWSHRQTTL